MLFQSNLHHDILYSSMSYLRYTKIKIGFFSLFVLHIFDFSIYFTDVFIYEIMFLFQIHIIVYLY